MDSNDRPEHLAWRTVTVAGRRAAYGVAGDGSPLVFLHGWGLGCRSYKRALKRLVEQGARVYAPALPGFGGTAPLPEEELSFEGFARWLSALLSIVGVSEPVALVGHSFGGGVAIQTAHDFPELVRSVILVNSVGGSAWAHTGSTIRSMAERPLWDWGLHLQRDLLPLRQLTRVLPVIVEDAFGNAVRNPRAAWRVAGLARRADLTLQLEELKRRRLPVVVLWGENDRVLTPAGLDSLRAAAGLDEAHCITVPGNHSWLLADPAAFGEIMTNVMGLTEPDGAALGSAA